jgi:hypothetical protein
MAAPKLSVLIVGGGKLALALLGSLFNDGNPLQESQGWLLELPCGHSHT